MLGWLRGMGETHLSIALENSRLAVAAAEKIARRLGELPDVAFVRAAFETVLSSTPTTEEQAECEAALKEWKQLTGPRANPSRP